jgi:maleate isomerase
VTKEAEIRRLIDERGVRSVTTSGSLSSALTHYGARRIAIATPYAAELTEDLVRFLNEGGREVVSIHAEGLWDPAQVADLTREDVIRMAHTVDTTQADAVFLSCTNLPTLGILAGLSGQLRKPVLSSNLVTMWATLRMAGLLKRAEELLPEAEDMWGEGRRGRDEPR